MLFFVALIVEYFWVRKFFLLSKGAIIIRRRGSSDDVVGGMWDVPRFENIPLGSVKVPSLGFLGLVTSGLSNLRRGISFVLRGICCLPCLMGLKIFCLFSCRMARGREETLPVRLGVKGGLPKKFPL